MLQPSSRAAVETMIAPARVPPERHTRTVPPAPDASPDRPIVERATPLDWARTLRDVLGARSSDAVDLAEEALRAWPTDPEILLLAALTALVGNLPDRALRLLKRYGKRYVAAQSMTLLSGLALAQQGQFARAWATLEPGQLHTNRVAALWFVGDERMPEWLFDRLREIRAERSRANGLLRNLPNGHPDALPRKQAVAPRKAARPAPLSLSRRSPPPRLPPHHRLWRICRGWKPALT